MNDAADFNDQQHAETSLPSPQLAYHFSPPITHQDLLKLSQLSQQQLEQLPLTRSDLCKIMQIKNSAEQKNCDSVPLPSQTTPHTTHIPLPSQTTSHITHHTSNSNHFHFPPSTAEDFEKLASLSEQEVSKLPLTRSDYEVLQKIKKRKQSMQSDPATQQKVKEQFDSLHQWQLHQPLTEQDFQQLIKLEKWQLSRLPLTLADRKKIFAILQARKPEAQTKQE